MIAGQVCKKSWVCPTDRELRLRARLNYGWSVNTTNLFRKVEVIPNAELEAIEKVLQRARELELFEVERVGRMLCRLENMTKNALGDGQKTCSMCGTESGLFRSSFVYCYDCAKAVCEKCRVDTVAVSLEIRMLCKICSENREVWKKSGGWFYGTFPTMTEESQKDCIALTSGSPAAARTFGMWEHRAPDIVRLESFEPPEENRNDNSLYKDWSMSSTPDINALDDDGDDDNDDDVYDDASYIELASFRSSYPDKNQSTLTVQDPKLSVSCPSLTDLHAESKLKRKPSIRRRKISNSARKMIKKISNKIHHS